MRKIVSYYSVVGTEFYLMDYVPGRLFKDPQLKGISPEDRRSIYNAGADVLAKIHSVHLKRTRLDDFGKQGDPNISSVERLMYGLTFCVTVADCSSSGVGVPE